jgi:hypothetical protein
LLLAVLLLGGVIGAGATYAYLRRQEGVAAGSEEARRRERLDAMTRELDLSGDQRTKIDAVLKASADERSRRFRAMVETCGEPFRQYKRQVDGEIRATLTPAQQQRFDELAAEQEKRFFPQRDAAGGK